MTFGLLGVPKVGFVNGRGDWTRTSDPLTPSQVRYRAALRPDLPKRPDPVSILGFLAQGKNHSGGIKRNETREKVFSEQKVLRSFLLRWVSLHLATNRVSERISLVGGQICVVTSMKTRAHPVWQSQSKGLVGSEDQLPTQRLCHRPSEPQISDPL
jgi:hypothetical protein